MFFQNHLNAEGLQNSLDSLSGYTELLQAENAHD